MQQKLITTLDTLQSARSLPRPLLPLSLSLTLSLFLSLSFTRSALLSLSILLNALFTLLSYPFLYLSFTFPFKPLFHLPSFTLFLPFILNPFLLLFHLPFLTFSLSFLHLPFFNFFFTFSSPYPVTCKLLRYTLSKNNTSTQHVTSARPRTHPRTHARQPRGPRSDVSFLGGSQMLPRNVDHYFVTFEDDDAKGDTRIKGQEGGGEDKREGQGVRGTSKG